MRTWYAIIVAALFTLAACGTGSGVCETSSDCAGAEQCLWMKRNGQVVGKRCVLKCAGDPECGGQRCSGAASSCPACNDFIRICEQ